MLLYIGASDLDLLAVLGKVAAFTIVSHIIALANPVGDVPGGDASVGVSVVVLSVIRHNGQLHGVLINHLHARQHIGRTSAVILAAHHGGGGTVGKLHIATGRGCQQQQLESIVLNGDGLAIVVDQAFIDGDGVGSGTVFIILPFPALQHRLVLHIVTFLIRNQGAVIVDHRGDHHVGSAIGNDAVGPVTGYIGIRTKDQLVLPSHRRGGGIGRSLRRSLSGLGGTVSGRLGGVCVGAAASSQGQDHDRSQQQS